MIEYIYVGDVIREMVCRKFGLEGNIYMNCKLYVEAAHGRDTYYVPIKENMLVGSLSRSVVKAMQVILDDCFTLGEYLDLKLIIEKIKDKKLADNFSMPTSYGEENGLDGQDYFKAYNVLEYLLGFSQSLSTTYPLDIFAIKFE